MSESLLSWGRWPRRPQRAIALDWLPDHLPTLGPSKLLPRGQGRSYGDSCLNSRGLLLTTGALDRVIHFDRETGVLRAEAGLTFDDLLRLCLPAGWFPPVTPGTRFLSLGGAVANDVHGKNHHGAGTIGHHVRALELLRSDGSRQRLTPADTSGLFRATIGGLGLTGLITWVELQLVPTRGPWFESHTVRFSTLAECFEIGPELQARHGYTAAWIDSLAPAGQSGRGLYICGDPSDSSEPAAWREPRLRIPLDCPEWLLNPLSLKLFNTLYYRQPLKQGRVHAWPFLYPLDVLADWNRIYGHRGFQQWQCVVPSADAPALCAELLSRIRAHRQGSFLALLKTFGSMDPAGLLSFARPGVTLALDFPMLGERTARMLQELNALVREAGGALYPAKDAQMSAEDFRSGYPRVEEFEGFRDPLLESDFWRRVRGGGEA
ncbi:MAG: FAD-binding oxidoreductase [Candidatus Cloacimonetes bacterium]|nr:FAD-binding oxidoreductase [Candidatus Cloacimonadota bacterium]